METAGGPKVSRRRDGAIDALRGLCIIPMVIGHMAGGSQLNNAVHYVRWIDGAAGFVLLSGLVLGMVQHRRQQTLTRNAAVVKLLRRAGFLYVAQSLVQILALLVREVSARPEALPTVQEVGGWASALWRVFTLQLVAPDLGVLSMYVVLILAAVPAAWLLRGRKAWVVAALSLVVYVVANVRPEWTVMPLVQQDGGARFNWGTWQALFFSGFLVGWFWRQGDLRERLRSPVVVGVAGVVAAGFVTLSVAVHHTGLGARTPAVVERVFGKFDLGPGVIVAAWAIFVVGYWALSLPVVANVGRLPLRYLEFIGRRSLDAFIVLCLAVVLLPALREYSEAGRQAEVLSIAVLLAITAWIAARDRWLPRAQVEDLVRLLRTKRPAFE